MNFNIDTDINDWDREHYSLNDFIEKKLAENIEGLIETKKLPKRKELEIEEMVEEMNKAVDNTLTIIHYTKWELSSYRSRSLFSLPKGVIRAESFTDLIEKGYKILQKEREK